MWGLDPVRVLDALLLQLPSDTLWIEIDPEEDPAVQAAELRKWLLQLKRRNFHWPGKRMLPKPEAPRDTLIFTLKESAKKKTIEIARKIYPDEFSPHTGPDLDDRVRTCLKRVRAALRAVGLLPPR